MDGETSRSLALEAVRGALADAGIELACVDGRHFKGIFYYGKILGTDWSVLCGHGAKGY